MRCIILITEKFEEDGTKRNELSVQKKKLMLTCIIWQGRNASPMLRFESKRRK